MTSEARRKFGIFFLLIFQFIFVQCTNENTPGIQYTISKSTIGGKSALLITMDFKADPSGVTNVLYDNEAWGEEELFNCITAVTTDIKEIALDIERDSGRIRLKHPKRLKNLQLQYTLQQDFEESGQRGESYRPLIREDYFHLFSHNMMMVPEHLAKEADDPLDVVLNWKGFPENYTIHNSFGNGLRTQELHAIPLQKFHQAIFVGGDFRVYPEEINGNKIYLALRGQWLPFKDTTVVKILSTTIKVQRDFWQDHSQEYFTVTMRPIIQEKGSSFQGTGLTNSFATSISNNTDTDIEQLVYLFNHELQHNWIGHTIENDNEEEQYWFSEGFTEYYTYKNISRHRIYNLDATYFISQLNGIIRNLYTSPVKDAPNSDINYENFWSDRDFGKLPYYRGALFAFYLDQLIKADSNEKNSLDDLMHDLHREAIEEGKKITHPYFINAVNKYLNGDIRAFFDNHIEMGKPIAIEDIFIRSGYEYTSETEVFDLGYRPSEDQQQVIWIDTSSAAYAAGLRVGDRLQSRSIYYGNTQQPVELTILREKVQKNIKYLPVKIAAIPQLTDAMKNIELLNL